MLVLEPQDEGALAGQGQTHSVDVWGPGSPQKGISYFNPVPKPYPAASPRQPPIYFVSKNLTIPDISHKWNRTFVVLCLAS